MTARLSCCVPFCRRTRAAGGCKEWVCGKHWSGVPAALRASYTAEKRLARRIVARKPLYREYWKMKPGCSDRLAAVAMWRKLDDAWNACRDKAIEQAGVL